VLTSEQGAARLRDSLPDSAGIVPLADQPPLDPGTAIAALRASGHELILCEGGPSLFAGLVAAGLVDELFLTRSPILAGRPVGEQRLALLEGGDLLPARTLAARLLTLRRAESHLFLRYALPRE
jgi:riboflavin biosynthesis pyrimidine reductase